MVEALMSSASKVPVRMSVAEFLAWDPADGRTWQLVDGEPQAMVPANRTHAALQGELGRLIGNHLVARSSPCAVLPTPGVVPNIQAGYNFRVPDLAVTCTGYTTEEWAISDPVLIVEVLSMSNRAETWANVWTYTTIPSVQEILVLHTVSVAADLLRRRPDGSWPKDPEAVVAGDLTLDSIGFRAPLIDLYRTTRLSGASG
jgi:Uma2 family endonuclease